MATEQDLKELKNKICDVVDNDTATKENWFALWKKLRSAENLVILIHGLNFIAPV